MSLITRCPTCATTFKVVPDQLRISDGWVRCGRCGEVFDAPANMHEASATDAAPAASLPSADRPEEPVAAAESPEPPLPAASSEAEAVDEAMHEPSSPLSVPLIDALPGASGASVIDAQWWQNQPSLEMPTPLPAADAAPHDESDAATVESITAVIVEAAEPPIMTPMTFRATADEGIPEKTGLPTPAFLPGFLKAKVQSAPLQPKARLWLAALVVVACVVLVLQVAFHERDLIAARQPELKPMLASLCQLAGCEVSAPRQIASITIDGASFSSEPGGNGYRLYFSLRNMAAMALKMPAIELTLLDTQERPVLRRILLPGDFGAPTALAPRAERAASLLLVLSGAEAATLPPLAGYHVDPFYP